ncbi:MAG: DEAD/DEAH box helicase [Phycisphaerae bacterium]|nr:DEAD/DEAH box helicase [Phycisphaerae bacterium]
MGYNLQNPLIVQGDHTVLVEVDSPRYEEARDHLARFAELVKSPEHIHTYQITPLSVWNAAAAGMSAGQIASILGEYAKYDVPSHVLTEVRDYASRYGRLKLHANGDDSLQLCATDAPLAEEIWRSKEAHQYLESREGPLSFRVLPLNRGRLKQALIKIGWPIEDLAGYVEGEALDVALRDVTVQGLSFSLRPYQWESVNVFYAGGEAAGGSGVITLPCGAGKTIVGMGVMARISTSTLILVTNTTAVHQWIREILDKTTLRPDQVGEYTGQAKEIRPVTVSTYQILTYRRSREDEFLHFGLFDGRDWGLIIYDEVHLLPAPVFQYTASIQARRRLGLTATLVREDGREDDVFALIGPKKFDVPWKVMEGQGWIATAVCTEVRVPLPKKMRMEYAVTEPRRKFRFASENPAKLPVLRQILAHHPDEQTLIIGTYVDHLRDIADELQVPVLTGKTSNAQREELYNEFRAGRLRALVVSKVANFAIDLPEAAVAIQVSGTFGSRQEEAQRLGRLLRPKPGANQAHFYTLTTRDTVEHDFALKRQLFLCEQGYAYHILDADDSPARTASLLSQT